MRRTYAALTVASALLLSGAMGCGGKDPTAPVYLSRDKLLDPMTCNECHPTHYQEWQSSMHAYASDDPLFVAMNERGQREAQVGDFCVKCHAPQAVREGATTDGLNLADVPQKLHGVTCFFCHAVDQVLDTHNNPLHLADDGAMRGAFMDPVANTAHPSTYSVLHDRERLESAQLCGSCHDIVNGHGAHIERTFEEWKDSVFVQPGLGSSCGQCHMDQSATLEPAAKAPGVFSRRLHSHRFPGVDLALTPLPDADVQRAQVQDFLAKRTLQSALCVRGIGLGTATIQVVLDAAGSGHSWPSGSAQDRRAWVEVNAYANGDPIYQSGVVPMGGHVNDITDPDIWIMRDCMLDDQDQEVHTFWDATQYESSQLPAQLTFDQTDVRYYQSHVYQTYPRSVASLSTVPDRVTMQVHLEAFGKDAFDDLASSSPAAAQALGPYADSLPNFTVGSALEWTAATGKVFTDKGLPVSCVSASLNAQADKVPVLPRQKCKP